VNYDVYRLLYREDLYILAYERIKSKPGNMTPGTDEETLDGFSLQAIREIIQDMRTEQFRFQPVRTTFLPKANGKMRKLGIPCVRDQVVQEVMHMILEAIYDSPNAPYFQETSHGFRPGRSCHTAWRECREKGSAVNWIVEGDIRACFDELDPRVLVSLLHKKIHEQRFLSLIWKLLKAGYMDLHGTQRESLVGSPQGSLVSPILANIYLHELDELVEGLRQELEKGEEKHRDPIYRKVSKHKARLAAKGETRTKECKALVKLMRTLPSRQVKDPEDLRIRSLRDADDWCVGVNGSHALAEEIKQRIKTFLWDHLKLT
jgi:group II intron reverse transcriptase/maturase